MVQLILQLARFGVMASMSLLFSAACVGPTTPLGALDHRSARHLGEWGRDVSVSGTNESHPTKPGIYFSPSYQQVHGPYTWEIIIIDPSGQATRDFSDIQIFYNGVDVSKAANYQFVPHYGKTLWGDQEVLVLGMPHLRLNTLDEHDIHVRYRTRNGEALSARYAFPSEIDIEAEESIQTTGPFDIEPEILDAIVEAAKTFRINPVILAALIAQESGFNPHALSKAKALGLTQITHLTEKDISRNFAKWPRYPSIERLPRRRLKKMIPEKINSRNEWRLDPVKSVWGGAYYLGYLKERVTYEKNLPIILKAGKKKEEAVTEASLAAYNSGLNRVLYIIDTKEEKWLEHRKIQEARRYIRKVISYYGMFKDSPEPIYILAGESS